MRETKRDIPLPAEIKASCEVHGTPSIFIRLDKSQVYACSSLPHGERGVKCASAMPFDTIGPDGGDVVNFALATPGQIETAVEEWKEVMGRLGYDMDDSRE